MAEKYPPFLWRVAEKFRLPLEEVDEWPVDAVLDEADLIGYLHDVDNPPPKKKQRAGVF